MIRECPELKVDGTAGCGKTARPVGGGARQLDLHGMWLMRPERGNPETELCRHLNNYNSSLTLLHTFGVSDRNAEVIFESFLRDSAGCLACASRQTTDYGLQTRITTDAAIG